MGTFRGDLKDSQKKYKWLTEAYVKCFGSCTLDYNNIKGDDGGRDLTVKTGDKNIIIDEKLRFYDYGDFLEEEYSIVDIGNWNFDKLDLSYRKIGWALDDSKKTDLISWVIVPSCKVYLIHAKPNRKLFFENHENWFKQYGRKQGKTKDKFDNLIYYTANISIPYEKIGDVIFWRNDEARNGRRI